MDDTRYLKILEEPDPVKFVVAVTYQPELKVGEILEPFESTFGKRDLTSGMFEFTQTKYYEPEMGSNLRKEFWSFHKLFTIMDLVPWKLFAQNLEGHLSKEGRRRANIDPAYMELAKLVVASTKNFAHRIYLGQGVYGDLQLRFKGGRFLSHEWTYPDYSSPKALGFFERVRQTYHQQLRHLA